MTIQVTLTFASEQELVAYFSGAKTAPISKIENYQAKKPAAASGPDTAPEAAAPSETTQASAPSTTAKPAAASSAATDPKPVSAAEAPAPTTAPAASTTSGAEVSFDQLKKAFLALSTKAGGRALCEGVLKPAGLAKLSEAKPEQYADLLAAIEKAAA